MIKIEKIFRVTCIDCGLIQEEKTWYLARKWLSSHHKNCQPFKARVGLKYLEFPKHGEIIACPICKKSRYLSPKYVKRTKVTNIKHPERIGLCRTCRMKYIKPARKELVTNKERAEVDSIGIKIYY